MSNCIDILISNAKKLNVDCEPPNSPLFVVFEGKKLDWEDTPEARGVPKGGKITVIVRGYPSG